MACRATAEYPAAHNGASLCFEAIMLAAADKLRNKIAVAGNNHVVLANASMPSNQSGEGEIRKNVIRAYLLDCMVALPGKLRRRDSFLPVARRADLLGGC